MGADALRSLLGEDGLSMESVDETMEKIQTVLQDQKEVEDALHIRTEDMMDTDTDEVEQELLDLIEQEQDFKKAKPISEHAPTISLPNSELSRLNQMFASSLNEPQQQQQQKKKQLELVS
jgi:GTPase SAR1 family protein